MDPQNCLAMDFLDWERRAEEPKGKAKGKDAKSRGKGKGDKGGLSKEERDKEKR